MKQENNARLFGLLAERTRQVVFIYQIESQQFSFINSAFEQVWQTSRERFYTNPLTLIETIHPQDKQYVLQSYQEVLQGQEKRDFEFRVLLPDNSTRWICLTPYLFADGQEEPFIAGFAQDINGQKKFSDTMKQLACQKKLCFRNTQP